MPHDKLSIIYYYSRACLCCISQETHISQHHFFLMIAHCIRLYCKTICSRYCIIIINEKATNNNSNSTNGMARKLPEREKKFRVQWDYSCRYCYQTLFQFSSLIIVVYRLQTNVQGISHSSLFAIKLMARRRSTLLKSFSLFPFPRKMRERETIRET